MKYKTPKYPRVQVTPERHAKLASEADRRHKSIAEIVELKLSK